MLFALVHSVDWTQSAQPLPRSIFLEDKVAVCYRNKLEFKASESSLFVLVKVTHLLVGRSSCSITFMRRCTNGACLLIRMPHI